jgi:hypothetical protein
MPIGDRAKEHVCIYGTKKHWREYDVEKNDFDKLGRRLLLGFQAKRKFLKMILKTVYVRLYNEGRMIPGQSYLKAGYGMFHGC